MKIDELRAVLERYQQGNCTPAEQKAVEEWYSSLRLGEEHVLAEDELEASLAKVHRQLWEQAGVAGNVSHWDVPRGRVRGFGGWRVVAMAAAVVLGVWGIWLLRRVGVRKGVVGDDGSTIVETGWGETR